MPPYGAGTSHLLNLQKCGCTPAIAKEPSQLWKRQCGFGILVSPCNLPTSTGRYEATNASKPYARRSMAIALSFNWETFSTRDAVQGTPSRSFRARGSRRVLPYSGLTFHTRLWRNKSISRMAPSAKNSPARSSSTVAMISASVPRARAAARYQIVCGSPELVRGKHPG